MGRFFILTLIKPNVAFLCLFCGINMSLSYVCRRNKCSYDPTRKFSAQKCHACEERVRLLREEMHRWYEDAKTLLDEIWSSRRRAERSGRRPH